MAKSKWSVGSDPLGVFHSGKRSTHHDCQVKIKFLPDGEGALQPARGAPPTLTGQVNEEEKWKKKAYQWKLGVDVCDVSFLMTFAAAHIRGPRGALFLSAFIFSCSLCALEFRGLRERTSVHPSITLPPLPPAPVAASLQLISGLQAVVTTHHIMTTGPPCWALPGHHLYI